MYYASNFFPFLPSFVSFLPIQTLTGGKTRIVSITKLTISLLRVLADAGEVCGEEGREGKGGGGEGGKRGREGGRRGKG